MNGFFIAPSSREIIEILQTNQCSPQFELLSTTHRQMAMSSYQRPRKIRRNTTISIFTQCVDESPENKKSKQKNYHTELKKLFIKVKISLSFINSLKDFHYKQRIERIDSRQWKRDSILPFYPDDYWISKWKKFIEFLTFICVILYPIYVCFDVKTLFEKFVMLFDIMFLLDVILNFLTAFIDDSNTLIADYQLIAENYIKTWFLWDVTSAIPTTKNEEDWLKYFKIVRVLKYFLNKKEVTYKGQQNYVRLTESLNPQATYSLTTGTKYLLNVLVTACLLIHIFGCWRHYFDYQDYITNIYWSAQTITTVGYGDLQTNYELSIFWMVIGVAFYSFTIGDFALMMQKSKVNYEQEVLFLVEQLGNSQNLSEKLKFKFSHFIKTNLTKNPFWMDDYKIMVKQLPYALKLYLTISAQLEICKQIPFFLYDMTYTQQLLLHLKFLTVEEGFVIYREGQNSSEVFFLLEGDVRIMSKDKSVLLNIMEGKIFGEFEAIEEKLRGTYCVAQRKSQLLVIPYRIFRKMMEQSPVLDFEIKQLHLRRRRLLINNFLLERRRKTEYRRQSVRLYTSSFLQMTRQEYELEKSKKQLFNVEEYNRQMLNKLIGKRLLKLQQFLIKFRRSVQRVIEMNHLLDETVPDQWKELHNYQQIKRVFPTEYLKQKFSMLSLSRKSSSVHSSVSKFSKMKYSTYSQQYFFAKLPEVRLKHIVLQHVRLTRNKFVPLQQIVNKYHDDPEGLNNNKIKNVERSIWNKKYTKISQTVILRIDQIEDSGDKYYEIMKKFKRIESIWLQGSMQKFELFQLMRGKQRQQFLD